MGFVCIPSSNIPALHSPGLSLHLKGKGRASFFFLISAMRDLFSLNIKMCLLIHKKNDRKSVGMLHYFLKINSLWLTSQTKLISGIGLMILGPLIIDFSAERGQEQLCSGQELCGENSLCECNFFMAREKPNFLDESQPRPCSEMSRPAGPLVL